RFACLHEAIDGLERVLGQGEPSPDALAAVQRILEEESDNPRLLVAARGERAGLNMLMENVESGVVSTNQILAIVNPARTSSHDPDPDIARDPLTLKNPHAWMPRGLNKFVEVAKLQPGERAARLKLLKARAKKDPPPLARLLLPSVEKVAEADQ